MIDLWQVKPGDQDSDDIGYLEEASGEDEVRREKILRAWADGACFTHWTGICFLGFFVATLINALPPRFEDPVWQLNTISLLLGNGATALTGGLLIGLAQLFDQANPQFRNRAQLVRKLARWVALGWLLLIPLQLFIGIGLINRQVRAERQQIRVFERVAQGVRQASTVPELGKAMAQLPNQAPLPPLTVPLAEARTYLLSQLQQSINTAKTNQDLASSNRLQIWLKEAFRNALQSLFLTLGFLAIGKHSLLEALSPGPGRR